VKRIYLSALIFTIIVGCDGKPGPTGPSSSDGTIPNSAVGAAGPTANTGLTASAETSGTAGSASTSDTTENDGASAVYSAGANAVNWADVIDEGNLYDNIYAIYYVPEGTNYVQFIGTGFAAGFSNVLWTNAHVVYALYERPGVKAFEFEFALARRSGRAWTDRSRISQLGLDGVRFIVHPNYDGTTNSEDVAAFVFHDEPFRYEPLPSLLPGRFVDDLREGQPVGTLGFPGELPDITGPEQIVTPTFKPGTLSAFRSLGTGGQNQRVLQYNLTVTGGTSGSPVFDHHGFVIGTNHASHRGREIADVDGNTVNVNTANASYAIRVDAMHELIPPIPVYNSPARVRRIVGERLYPYVVYQPFP
jgi:hypothetical protein